MSDARMNDERERCALLCEDLAGRWALGAQKVRKDGTFKTWALKFWPPRFASVEVVAPKWEKAARDVESGASGLLTVALGIREGWDVRSFEPEPLDAARAAALQNLIDRRDIERAAKRRANASPEVTAIIKGMRC